MDKEQRDEIQEWYNKQTADAERTQTYIYDVSYSRVGLLLADNTRLREQVGELQDFAIWMTGCGYDFCQHEYFCKQRDKLLKNWSASESQALESDDG